MNFIKKFFSRGVANASHSSDQVDNSRSLSERQNKIYGEDIISRKRLYEHWICKAEWLLVTEAIPLIFGVDPQNSNIDTVQKNRFDELLKHAKACINNNLLSVMNLEQKEKAWSVRPAEFYSWAVVSRIEVPAELNELMQFVLQTIKKPLSNTVNSSDDKALQDALHVKHREIALGACVSLLVNAPDRCKNKKNKIMSELIARQIIKSEKQWYADEKTLLSESAIKDLIDHYLKTGKPLAF